MKTLLLFTFALTINNCFSQAFETEKHDFAKPGTVVYRQMKCGLYVSSKGDIAFKTEELLNDEGERRIRYLNAIYGANPNDTEWVSTEMKFVIDTLTFKFLSDVFWIDKNHIYVLQPMSDGGHIAVSERIDRKTFTVFKNSWYGKDKNNIYFKSSPVKDADIKSFKVFAAAGFEYYAYDNGFYYSGGERISNEEAESKGLDKLKKHVGRK